MTYKVIVSEEEQNFKVTFDSDYTYNVSASQQSNFKLISGVGLTTYNVKSQKTTSQKTTFSYTVELMPQNLDELSDVEISEINGEQDKYVLVYNASTQKWQAVNPDVVLSAAATEPIQPGLPEDFIDETEQSLNIDGGGF